MNESRRVGITLFVLAAIPFAGCKLRTPRADTQVESQEQTSRVLATQQIEALPLAVNDAIIPVGTLPGIVIGVTPNAAQQFNQVATDAVKERAYARLFEQLSRNSKPFFVVAAVNIEKLSPVKRPFVGRLLKSQSVEEHRRLYQSEFAPWKDTQELERHLLLVDDRSKVIHLAFGLTPAETPGVEALIPLAVVSQRGEVYGPFMIGGSEIDISMQLDEVFALLNRLLN